MSLVDMTPKERDEYEQQEARRREWAMLDMEADDRERWSLAVIVAAAPLAPKTQTEGDG